MGRLSLADLPLKGKKVLIRVDFNVPLDQNGDIIDDTRIEASLPTIKYVIEQGGFPIIMSHLGRPKGKVLPEFSLAPCAKRLSMMLGKPVVMTKDCIGEEVENAVQRLEPGTTLLLENLRFHSGEEKPTEDPTFAEQLAKLGDLYINDAFGTAHRVHSSTTSIVDYFPGRAAAGYLLEKEIKFLGETFSKPRRPFYAIIGGAKVSTKIGVIKSLIGKIDALLIGGAMAFTFLKAQGIEIGDSKYEPDRVDTAKGILDAFQKAGVRIMLPLDHVIVNEVSNEAPISVVDNAQGIPTGYMGVDVGPKTIEAFSKELKNAATIFWNGPLGVYELSKFAKGTKALAEALADVNATKIVGGGDSVAVIRSANLVHKFTHLSTGGGASLEYIELGKLPGIEALEKAGQV
ncbi:MAG: Bifunctional PGK/TIM [Chlamydiae bacterium]|nr:Bifunctional PGK/TIM [Chlamydiota bacterium]